MRAVAEFADSAGGDLGNGNNTSKYCKLDQEKFVMYNKLCLMNDFTASCVWLRVFSFPSVYRVRPPFGTFQVL